MICRPSPAGGNITTDHRGRDYVYDAENVLRSVKKVDDTALSNLYYYADGTLRLATGMGRLYYDGDQEIAEFTDPWPLGGGDEWLRRRYVRLPGSVDEPFLMIDFTLGGCTNTSHANCEVWAHQNRLGSVIATTDSAGAVIEKYTYSPYGESGPEGVRRSRCCVCSANGHHSFPFRLTGQKLNAESVIKSARICCGVKCGVADG